MVNDAKDDDERDAPACVASFLPLLLDLSACLFFFMDCLRNVHTRKREEGKESARDCQSCGAKILRSLSERLSPPFIVATFIWNGRYYSLRRPLKSNILLSPCQ